MINNQNKIINLNTDLIDREEQLDGLRGVAALIVMNSHFICAFFPYLNSKFFPEIFSDSDNLNILIRFLQSPILSIIFNGHAAVCVFFVLSGHVLSISFHKKKLDKLFKTLFGRYLRLNIPTAFVTCISLLFSELNLYKNSIVAGLSNSNWMDYWYREDQMNILNAFNSSLYKGILYGDDNFIPPLWTIKIEFLASILLLSYLIFTFKKDQKLTLPLFLIFLTFVFKNEALYYYLFVAGAFLKLIPNLKKSYCYPLAIVSLYFISFQNSFHYEIFSEIQYAFPERILYHGIGSILLVYCIRQGFLNKYLKSRMNLFLGKISFSLYLIHHLILCSLISYLYVEFDESIYSFVFLYFFYISSSILLSFFILNKVDNFGIKLSKKISFRILNFLKINLRMRL